MEIRSTSKPARGRVRAMVAVRAPAPWGPKGLRSEIVLEWSTIFHVSFIRAPLIPCPRLNLATTVFGAWIMWIAAHFFVSRKRASCETQSSFLPTL